MENRKKSSKAVVLLIGLIIFLFFLMWGISLVVAFVGGLPLIALIIGLIIVISLSCAVVYVTVQRIKEIQGGEEDDISKY